VSSSDTDTVQPLASRSQHLSNGNFGVSAASSRLIMITLQAALASKLGSNDVPAPAQLRWLPPKGARPH
jgi:hypothetical protein